VELLFSETGFNELKSKDLELFQLIQQTCDQSVALQNKIESAQWEGKSKKEFYAFFDLITQFHKALVEDTMEYEKNQLSELCEKISQFCSNSAIYNQL